MDAELKQYLNVIIVLLALNIGLLAVLVSVTDFRTNPVFDQFRLVVLPVVFGGGVLFIVGVGVVLISKLQRSL